MRRWWPLAAVVVSGAGATVLSWFVAQHSLLGARWSFFAPLGAWAVLWVAGSWSAARLPAGRVAVVAIVGVAAVLRLAAATGTTPSISNDLYRYGWDAHVQFSGIDPYRYPPSAPQLLGLREDPWFPDAAGCAHIGKRPGCTTMNRPGDRTIYPPVAEAWFDAVSLVAPGGSARVWQLAGGAVDTAVVVLLMLGLARTGRDPRHAAWYALSPIPVVEFAGNGHVDGLALLFLLAALLAIQRGRRRVAGLFIGLAAMVKLYPAVAVVAFWRRGRWAMALTAGAVCVASYLPHVLVVGGRVVGYLPGYLKEEHYSDAARFLLISVLPLPQPVVSVLAVAAVLASVLWVLRRDRDPALGVAVLLVTAVLVSSPVQPWYAAGLAGIGVLLGYPWLVAPALTAEIYYAAVVLDDPHQVAVGRLCYGLALLAVLVPVAVARRRSPPRSEVSAHQVTAVVV